LRTTYLETSWEPRRAFNKWSAFTCDLYSITTFIGIGWFVDAEWAAMSGGVFGFNVFLRRPIVG